MNKQISMTTLKYIQRCLGYICAVFTPDVFSKLYIRHWIDVSHSIMDRERSVVVVL